MNSINSSGLYVVTLNNIKPISVNSHDKRIADKCIKVTKNNCKFGKANNFHIRRNNYFKTFGEENVNFHPIATINTELLSTVEKLVLQKLDSYRLRGLSGRKTEWLKSISLKKIKDIALDVLKNNS